MDESIVDLFNCPTCPSEELGNLCKELSDMPDVQVLACEEDQDARPTLAYIELRQSIRVTTPGYSGTILVPVQYRYYLNLNQGPPRYDGTLPTAILVRDPEIFVEQFIQVNNIGDDVLDQFSWDLRLDTQGVDVDHLPSQLNIKLARKDRSNRETYVSDFIKAMVELDAAILTFFHRWTPPTP